MFCLSIGLLTLCSRWLERDRLRTLRETLASRRRTISAAKLQSNLSSSPLQSPTPSLSSSPYRDGEALSNLSSTIARARSGLVQELVEVFNVVEVGGRPPIGGKAGTKGEWTIGDLILPVPGDMRRNLTLPLFCIISLTNPSNQVTHQIISTPF